MDTFNEDRKRQENQLRSGKHYLSSFTNWVNEWTISQFSVSF